MDAERETTTLFETLFAPDNPSGAFLRPVPSRKRFVPLILVLGLMGCGQVTPPSHPEASPRSDSLPVPDLLPSTARVGTSAPIVVYFSDVWRSTSSNRANPSNIAMQCAQAIDSARLSLDVCVEEIDDPVIIDAIVRASRRGVRVRVVTEGDFLDALGPRSLRAEGIEVVGDNRQSRMHNKFLVIDRQTVWTGSGNFTVRCAYRNNNNAVLINSLELGENYSEKFRAFWELRKFGGRPSNQASPPRSTVKLSDGTVVETYFAPRDRIDRRLVDLVRKTQRSIRFLAFRFTNDELAQAMLDRAEEGVRVQGVLDTRQNSSLSEFDRLKFHRNVEVLLDGNKHEMHHKVLILDDEIVITGSMDFETGAGEANDENVVILHGGKFAERFNDEFSRLHRSAITSLAGKLPDLVR